MSDTSWRRESELRDYLYDHPEILFNEPVTQKYRELRVEGKFIDLLFEVGGVHHIVELKRDQVTREAVGQVLEYYGRLRRLNPQRVYRVMLVASIIPEYRRLPLEEFGIRCVEMPPSLRLECLAELDGTQAESDGKKIGSIVKKSPPFPSAPFNVEAISFESFLPPCSQNSLQLSHKMLVDSLPYLEREFPQFEIMPVRMMHAQHQDVLCLSNGAGLIEYVRPGVWWAYAFGESEHMPKNDKPNISVNGYPWGLDFAVNAELRTSQRVVLEHVGKSRNRFDELIAAHGSLELQLWLKLEHQPRFYHWALLERRSSGEWDGTALLELEATMRQKYSALRDRWMEEIFANQTSLTEAQKNHMGRKNKELNVAIRIVQTIRPDDAVWTKKYEPQLEVLNACYKSLEPLIGFFY